MIEITNRVAIIGAGSVGAAVAYAVLLRHVCSEVVLNDVDEKVCKGQVADLEDGSFLTNSRVKYGTLKDCGQCDLIVITAGAKQREGETRVQLIDRNHAILKSVINGMKPLKPSAILLLVSNPVDVLAYFAQKLSGLPPNQVFGSGTFLDTARLRRAIAHKVGVADTAVHAYVLGEHGDSQFCAWSSAHIGNVPLLSFDDFKDENELNDIATKTKNKAYDIIKAKGATYFGIAAVVSSIAEAVFMDQRHIRPLSVYDDNLKVCISLPAVVGRNGIERIIRIPLNEKESAALQSSADDLRKIIDQYEEKLPQ